MRHTIKAITAATLLAASTIAVSGVETATDANDVILAGHDTVAYFTENKPVVGSERYTAQHDGAVYRFASAANRGQFRANPAKYAPAYGGYCAFGASLGKKFDVDGPPDPMMRPVRGLETSPSSSPLSAMACCMARKL